MSEDEARRRSPSVGEPGYLPYCGNCVSLQRMERKEAFFKCPACGKEGRRVNGEDMFDRTDPALRAGSQS